MLGTSAESVAAARAEIAAALGREPRGYTDVAVLVAEEQLDALAILSPPETHERYLNAALACSPISSRNRSWR